MLTNNPYVQNTRLEEKAGNGGQKQTVLIVETQLKRPAFGSEQLNDNAYASLAEDLKHLQMMAKNGFADFDSIEVRTIN